MPEIQSNQEISNPPEPNKPAETSQTNQPQPPATASTSPKNPCQGFQVDPLTKLHLCQTCPYHRYRNQTKPWLGKERRIELKIGLTSTKNNYYGTLTLK